MTRYEKRVSAYLNTAEIYACNELKKTGDYSNYELWNKHFHQKMAELTQHFRVKFSPEKRNSNAIN